MGKIIAGKYIYSLDDCRCEYCLYFQIGAGGCRLAECCCLEEKDRALVHFPPYGFERRKRGTPCRG